VVEVRERKDSDNDDHQKKEYFHAYLHCRFGSADLVP
jgi:hypothetical protein